MLEHEAWTKNGQMEFHVEWFRETEGMSVEERRKAYGNYVDELFLQKPQISDREENELTGDQAEEWRKLYNKKQILEEKKVPEKYWEYWPDNFENIPVTELNTLAENVYVEIAETCRSACNILPQSAMKKQEARNYGDAMVVAMKNQRWSYGIEYGKYCLEGYEGLICFQDRNMSDADLDYWLADTNFQLFYNYQPGYLNILPDEDMKLHFLLCADAFAQKGCRLCEKEGYAENTIVNNQDKLNNRTEEIENALNRYRR
ncbi:MAG: hypothetical protein ACI4HI_03435 [Lachnospiraceae bacterium]